MILILLIFLIIDVFTYNDSKQLHRNHGGLIKSDLNPFTNVKNILKFKELRNEFEGELTAVLNHMKDFADNISKDYPEHGWFRKGPATSYAFLLVAKPSHYNSVDPYVKRVTELFQQGVGRTSEPGCCGSLFQTRCNPPDP